MKIKCPICPHKCFLADEEIGFCKARKNRDGKIVCENYGKISSMALDPIEKKPLRNFMPGSKILSVGSYGCNLRCQFCQNHTISMSDGKDLQLFSITPNELVEKAIQLKEMGNIGIAYTYNEPLIGYEFVYDCALLAKVVGMKNVVVTNGYVCQEPLMELLPTIDAMNIDLKGFTEGYYKKLAGDLETVKNTIQIASERCHIEVTTLIVPGENDTEEEMANMAKWLSELREDIPLHISRFYPRYKYLDKEPTTTSSINDLSEVARRYLKYVYSN